MNDTRLYGIFVLMTRIYNIAFLISFCLFFLSCTQKEYKSKALSDFIPEQVNVVFQISDLGSLRSDIGNNSLLPNYKSSSSYSFISKLKVLDSIQSKGKGLLCLNDVDYQTEYTYITRQKDSTPFQRSISGVSLEPYQFNKLDLYRSVTLEDTIYLMNQDSILVVSSSKHLLKSIDDGKVEQSDGFKKIIKINFDDDLTSIIRADSISLSESIKVDLASWLGLNLKILPNGITATGVALDQDSTSQLISIFKGLIPQKNDIAKVVPLESNSVLSFTYNDFEILNQNLKNYRKENDSTDVVNDLFGSINEIGLIRSDLGDAVVLKSLDQVITLEALSKYSNELEAFKEVMLYEFTENNLFVDRFDPLIRGAQPSFCFQLGDFFIFTDNDELSKHIITSYLNNNCLYSTRFYTDSSSQLSSASSLLLFKMNGNIGSLFSPFFSTEVQHEISDVNPKDYPLATLQFIYDRDFAHVNLVCKEANKGKPSAGLVSQILQIQLDELLLNEPQFFSNHRTGGKDIVVQDINNEIHLISSNGKVLWSKQLKDPVLGNVEEVDILRNGKKQLIFATKNSVHVLDRNGRSVAPFPLKFKDDITQPLSVFDYDNNRKYRFVVTQDNEVFMYDSKGKSVKGFKFKKTSSSIVLPPEHIRIDHKDYILIAEANGKLNILSRVGKHRVHVSNSFDFSEIPITREGKNFVVISKDENNTKQIKNSISQSGKVNQQKLDVSSYWFTISGTTKVTIDDNLMRINGKLVELPFGIYTQPKIFNINKRTLIAITETQEKKVYVFERSGEMLSGFPIYGTSAIDMGDVNKDGTIDILVGGGDRDILVFELK
jgi:hypothetical protein